MEITADILFFPIHHLQENLTVLHSEKNPLIMTRVKSTNKTTQELLESLQGNNDIESAEANYLFFINWMMQSIWKIAMNNGIFFREKTHRSMLKLHGMKALPEKELWLPVIDSGVDTDHPDLKIMLLPEKIFCAGSTCGKMMIRIQKKKQFTELMSPELLPLRKMTAESLESLQTQKLCHSKFLVPQMEPTLLLFFRR